MTYSSHQSGYIHPNAQQAQSQQAAAAAAAAFQPYAVHHHDPNLYQIPAQPQLVDAVSKHDINTHQQLSYRNPASSYYMQQGGMPQHHQYTQENVPLELVAPTDVSAYQTYPTYDMSMAAAAPQYHTTRYSLSMPMRPNSTTAVRPRESRAWTNPRVAAGRHVALLEENKARLDKATPGKKGNYFCSHCTSQFRTILDMARHMDQHGLCRQFHCEHEDCPWYVCGFSTASEWSRHTKSQHGTVITISCSQCNKGFTRKDSLKRHMNLVHENKNSRYNRKLRTLQEAKRI